MTNLTRITSLLAKLTFAVSLLAARSEEVWAVDFPGPEPGTARGQVEADLLVLENDVLACNWSVGNECLKPTLLRNKISGVRFDLADSECFHVVLTDSPLSRQQICTSSSLRIVGTPRLIEIAPVADSTRAAEQTRGLGIAVDLASGNGTLKAEWQAVLRDGSNYLRQQVNLSSSKESQELATLVCWDIPVNDPYVAGQVDGAPAVSQDAFFACEHPMSWTRVLDSTGSVGGGKRLQCGYDFQACLRPSTTLTQTWVAGVVPPGQLRRGFLYYLERERAHPHRPFLHYNNGSEIGCQYWQQRLHDDPGKAQSFRQSQQQIWLKNIDAFGEELVTQRGVIMHSFVHDFEWDDETLVWRFHEGYPDGFAPAQRVAERYNSKLGVWLSPWGGYPGRGARIESGQQQALETNDKGLSLAGPRYYARVRTACGDMVRRYGVNYFKFDGFGAGNNQAGAGQYASDVEALLRLIDELRDLEPTLFVNPSTGSWPSPFWLRWADSIWRQGSDTHVAGKGSQRQQWITYRDSEVYKGIVTKSPLYPLNSLMIHGVFVNHLPLFGNPYDPNNQRPSYDPVDIIAEIRSFFGTGVNLQELYVAPDLMTSELWDALAEAANWARKNSHVFVDTHWVGGDPAKGEVYGWASWTKRKAILVLRNPADTPARISLDIAHVFELPEGAPQEYGMRSPWQADADLPPITLSAGRSHTFQLRPFGVICLDAEPAGLHASE